MNNCRVVSVTRFGFMAESPEDADECVFVSTYCMGPPSRVTFYGGYEGGTYYKVYTEGGARLKIRVGTIVRVRVTGSAKIGDTGKHAYVGELVL